MLDLGFVDFPYHMLGKHSVCSSRLSTLILFLTLFLYDNYSFADNPKKRASFGDRMVGCFIIFFQLFAYRLFAMEAIEDFQGIYHILFFCIDDFISDTCFVPLYLWDYVANYESSPFVLLQRELSTY